MEKKLNSKFIMRAPSQDGVTLHQSNEGVWCCFPDVITSV